MRSGCMAQVVPIPPFINPARWYIYGAAQIRRGLPLVDAVILGAPRFSPYRSHAPFKERFGVLDQCAAEPWLSCGGSPASSIGNTFPSDVPLSALGHARRWVAAPTWQPRKIGLVSL
jgi:hypothetical protein